MRAVRLHHRAAIDSAPLRLEEVPDPVPARGELLIDVEVCAVCRTDLHVVEGDLGDSGRLPVIPGHQVVGRVAALGPDTTGPAPGSRVGLAWLHGTCGRCRYCLSGRENLCVAPTFTGHTVDGGYAERVKARADFVYPLPAGYDARAAAPLLCAGIIGYRALALTGLDGAGWAGARLGIYGFGAAGHVAIQIARARGAEVYVATRDHDRHQTLATELGARWVGGARDAPPDPLDAAVIFAPAGELVPVALAALAPGATLVLGGIHMSDIPAFPYRLLYGERAVRSVANNTRADGHAFLAEAARIGLTTHTRPYPLAAANQALAALKHDAIRGAGVIEIG
jgi:alcohol dehydrogenase, propanol-preferring